MKVNQIQGSVEHALGYKVILCDLWGVIHNGKALFQHSISFLEHMKENNIKVIFLSNAPRPNYVVEDGLNKKLGLNKDLYDGLITSGDISCEQINKKIHGESYFHLGPSKDFDLLERISIQRKDISTDFDFILCTGLLDDEIEQPETYKDQFENFINKNLKLICANPDEIVYRGDKMISCAGGMAKYYSSLGGDTKSYGKPHQEIYEYAFNIIKKEGMCESKSEILAIGDSIKTDIYGAEKFGIDSILIQDGIHKDAIKGEEDVMNLVKEFLDIDLQKIVTIKHL